MQPPCPVPVPRAGRAACRGAGRWAGFRRGGGGGGAAAAQAGEVGPEVARIKQATDLPVIVGFGISTPEAARSIAGVADGCVVGSAIVKEIGAGKSVAEVLAFVATLAAGAHSA